jgi:hypothetical protein
MAALIGTGLVRVRNELPRKCLGRHVTILKTSSMKLDTKTYDSFRRVVIYLAKAKDKITPSGITRSATSFAT